MDATDPQLVVVHCLNMTNCTTHNGTRRLGKACCAHELRMIKAKHQSDNGQDNSAFVSFGAGWEVFG
jgi:hypothetical protein